MKVTILTEGGRNIGFGHITRCIALYQAFRKKDFKVNIVIKGDSSVKPILTGLRYNLCDWINNVALETYIKKANIVIIDSYLAPKKVYEFISEKIKIAVYIDDFKRIKYPKGIVVNGSIGAEKINYPIKKGVKYLLGVKYIPLRKEFWSVPKKKIRKYIKNILISFGGTDTTGLACKLADYLKERYDFDITVIHSKNHLSASKIKKEMLKTDLCISACGQTTYELARCGVPVIGIGFAENQKININGWTDAGFMSFVGWKINNKLFDKILIIINSLKYQSRVKMSLLGRKIVNGKGAIRVSNAAILRADKKKDFKFILRKAVMADCKNIFTLSNDTLVREESINDEKIKWTEHVKWFKKKIKHSSCLFLVILGDDGNFLGQLRYDIYGTSAVVSISLVKELRGKGTAPSILLKGSYFVFGQCSLITQIKAYIKPENIASIKSFEKAGYFFDSKEVLQDVQMSRYIQNRSTLNHENRQ